MGQHSWTSTSPSNCLMKFNVLIVSNWCSNSSFWTYKTNVNNLLHWYKGNRSKLLKKQEIKNDYEFVLNFAHDDFVNCENICHQRQVKESFKHKSFISCVKTHNIREKWKRASNTRASRNMKHQIGMKETFECEAS